MGRLVLAGALAGAVLASCYQPALVDCADTCGTSGLCPGGLACIDGYCRVAGATGACAAAKTDAGGGDAPAGACPMAPQGHGTPVLCDDARPAMPTAPQCYVACGSAATGTNASMFQLMTWRAAAIGGSDNEAAAAQVAAGAETWLGLVAADGAGSNKAAWQWTNGAAMTYSSWANGQPVDQGGAGNCGALTGSGWVSEPCTKQLPFLIASPM